MTIRIRTLTLKVLQPALLAATIVLLGPLFSIMSGAFSGGQPKPATTEVQLKLTPMRTTVVYKTDFFGT